MEKEAAEISLRRRLAIFLACWLTIRPFVFGIFPMIWRLC
jgi:hypothetical protein